MQGQNDITDELDIFQQFLADQGLRLTRQRRAIVEVFYQSQGHLSLRSSWIGLGSVSTPSATLRCTEP